MYFIYGFRPMLLTLMAKTIPRRQLFMVNRLTVDAALVVHITCPVDSLIKRMGVLVIPFNSNNDNDNNINNNDNNNINNNDDNNVFICLS